MIDPTTSTHLVASLTQLQTHVAAAISNPLDHIVPNFSFAGAKFTQLWQKAVAAVWAIGIIISIIYLILGLAQMAGASGDVNPNPQAHGVGRRKAMWALISLGILAALATVVGAILTFANPAIANPLNNVLPNFAFGGAKFTQLWQKALAAAWAIGIIISVIFLIIGIVGMAGASGDVNPNPQAHSVGRRKAMWAGISLGCLAALAAIVGAVLTFAS